MLHLAGLRVNSESEIRRTPHCPACTAKKTTLPLTAGDGPATVGIALLDAGMGGGQGQMGNVQGMFTSELCCIDCFYFLTAMLWF